MTAPESLNRLNQYSADVQEARADISSGSRDLIGGVSLLVLCFILFNDLTQRVGVPPDQTAIMTTEALFSGFAAIHGSIKTPRGLAHIITSNARLIAAEHQRAEALDKMRNG